MKYIFIFAISIICALLNATTAVAKEQLDSEILRDMADTKYYSEQYPEALELYIKAMAMAEKENNQKNYIACTGYIGNVYDTFGDNNSSLYYFTKGYNAAHKLGNNLLLSSFICNLIFCHTRMNNAQMARKYLEEYEKLKVASDIIKHDYYGIYCRARVLNTEQRHDEAIREHRRAMQYAIKNNMDSLYVLFQMSEIGNIYVRCGRNREALALGDSCVAMARKIKSGELLVNAYKMLADTYAQTGNYDSAQHYRNLYFSLNDSVYNIKKFYKARYTLSEYENRVHMNQVELLNERIKWQVYIITGVALFLILVSVLTLIIVRKNRRLVLAQRLLIEKTKAMEQSEKQNREILKQEIKTQATISDDNERKLLNRINEAMDNTDVISNPDMNLQTLAEIVESNTTYVSHVINANYNKNFKTLLNERRIREACHKLADRDHYANYTMQAIYQEVGYKNAASFIRAFKKVYGMTPSEYQRLVLTEAPTETSEEE